MPSLGSATACEFAKMRLRVAHDLSGALCTALARGDCRTDVFFQPEAHVCGRLQALAHGERLKTRGAFRQREDRACKSICCCSEDTSENQREQPCCSAPVGSNSLKSIIDLVKALERFISEPAESDR